MFFLFFFNGPNYLMIDDVVCFAQLKHHLEEDQVISDSESSDNHPSQGPRMR
jgi:hypothetical protein